MARLVGSSKKLNTRELLIFPSSVDVSDTRWRGVRYIPRAGATPPAPAPKLPAGAKLLTQAWSARAGKSKADDPSGKGKAPMDELPSTLPPDPLKEEHNYGTWLIARRRRWRNMGKVESALPPTADQLGPLALGNAACTPPPPKTALRPPCFDSEQLPGGVFRAAGDSLGSPLGPASGEAWWNKPIQAKVPGQKRRKSATDDLNFDGGDASSSRGP
ncbi:hypothetical protein KSP39_PZI003211 [Platanthera zijinensis]|uniref:Uncharacterized protein n=1 Tax=Platanthera zijinensis TaxID=2320716 RepID=A0AAP0GD62_9ASPA